MGYETADPRQSIALQQHQTLNLSIYRHSQTKGSLQLNALPALIESGIAVHYVVVGIGEKGPKLSLQALKNKFAERDHFDHTSAHQ